jgi:hypothetical protein
VNNFPTSIQVFSNDLYCFTGFGFDFVTACRTPKAGRK